MSAPLVADVADALAATPGVPVPDRPVAEQEALAAALVRDRAPLLAPPEVAAVVRAARAAVAGLGPLEPLLADASVSEVMVNGDGRVWVERAGQVRPTDPHLDDGTRGLLIERIVGPLGLRVDRSRPLVDARLPDGSRVNVVVPPLSVDGPAFTIRRFGVRHRPLSAFAEAPVVGLLTAAVRARRSLLVSGGTGSGKTSLLNALAGCIPADTRVVTIEDAAELDLPLPDVVRLEARPSGEGMEAVPIRALVRNALRMRPDRIIVGEVRGAEALDMVQAMHTGHEGSLSTCHANDVADALRRVETMVLMADVGLPLDAVRDQVASALDLVVHVVRDRGGVRRVDGVAAVDDPDPDHRGRIGLRPLVRRGRLLPGVRVDG